MKNPVLKEGSYHDHCAEDDGTDPSEDFTLRDFFAGTAVIGILADHTYMGDRLDLVERSYAIADAMLEERGKNHV